MDKIKQNLENSSRVKTTSHHGQGHSSIYYYYYYYYYKVQNQPTNKTV